MIRQAALETASAGVWNVPTQTLFENIAGPVPLGDLMARPEYRYVDPDLLAEWLEGVAAYPGGSSTKRRARQR